MNSIVSEKRFISERIGVPYENLSQSYLRAETVLGTQSVIDFVLQTNKKSNSLVTERLLDLNDEFVITHFTVGLKAIASDTPTDTQQLVAPVLTYNNATAFAGANGGNVAAIYNSGLYAFYPSEPTKIDGRQTIDLAINLGSSTTFDDASNSYYAVFEARGYLIVNAKS